MRFLVLLVLVACHAQPRTAAPSKVTLTYLGTAGWQIDDGVHVVLVDPYLSRPALDGPLLSDPQAIAAHAPARADLILVSHSHFDHLLDVPEVARRTGAQVLGSESTVNLARGAGLAADRLITVKGGEDYQFDGFSVRVLPSLHSALDDKHTFGSSSTISADVQLPMPASGYGEGGTFAYLVRMSGREILVLGTANFIERELVGIHPDAAIVATGLREQIHDYSCRLMRVLDRPRLVLANHFDAWREPIGTSISDGAAADLARFAAEIHACAPAVRVLVPEHFAAIAVD